MRHHPQALLQELKKRSRPEMDEDAPLSKRGRLEGPNTSGLGSQISAADEEEEVKQARKTGVHDRRFLFKVISCTMPCAHDCIFRIEHMLASQPWRCANARP